MLAFRAFRCCCDHSMTVPTTTRFYSDFKYVQGQYNKENSKVREYFYTVDHNGQLFLDDARMKNFTSCFKDQKFLRFFYSRIRRTEPDKSNVERWFQFTSHCGPERNYVRVCATPFVFTNFSNDGSCDDNRVVEYNYTGLVDEFVPESLYVGSDGRLYHQFTRSKHVTFALVKSSVADLISLKFEYDKDVPVAYKKGPSSIVPLNNNLRNTVEETLLLHRAAQ